MSEEIRAVPNSPTDQSDNAHGSTSEWIGPGAILARASNVFFSGSPVFWSIQGSYNADGRSPPPVSEELPPAGGRHNTSDYNLAEGNHGTDTSSTPNTLLGRVKEKSSVELYRALDKKKLGIALHIPQPNARLSVSDRRQGVCVGSIGMITPERSFDHIFNIGSDRFNPFKPAFESRDVREFKEFSSGTFLATPGIYRVPLGDTQSRKIAMFECDAKEGALLLMPEGAHLEQLTNKLRLEHYIQQNAASLYDYANESKYRQFKNGELSVVYSCRKATSWGISTFQNTSAACKIEMTLLKRDHSYWQSAGARYIWDCRGTVEAKVGPEDENDDLGTANGPMVGSLKNQCLFVRTIKIKLAQSVWDRAFPLRIRAPGLYDDDVVQDRHGVAASLSSSLSPSLPPSLLSSQTSAAVDSPATSVSHLSDRSSSAASTLAGEEDNMEESAFDPTQRLSDIVTDFLLKKFPNATAAISSDRDWSLCSSLDQSPDDLFDEMCKFNDICEHNGLAHFEPKEHFPPEDDRRTLLEGLKSGSLPLHVYLFGSTQSREERHELLSGLINALQAAPELRPSPISRLMLLDGHPPRIVPLDEALEWALSATRTSSPHISIRKLREDLNRALSSKSQLETALCGQRLAEALLKRFWTLSHEDDLNEAIWAFADARVLTPGGTYRRLEICLDYASALFCRYQMLHSDEDLKTLLTLLGEQKDSTQSPLYSWIWGGLSALLIPPPRAAKSVEVGTTVLEFKSPMKAIGWPEYSLAAKDSTKLGKERDAQVEAVLRGRESVYKKVKRRVGKALKLKLGRM